MISDITLGQYFPGSSLFHRLDPRTKIIASILYMVAVFCAKNLFTYLFLILVTESSRTERYLVRLAYLIDRDIADFHAQ